MILAESNVSLLIGSYRLAGSLMSWIVHLCHGFRGARTDGSGSARSIGSTNITRRNIFRV